MDPASKRRTIVVDAVVVVGVADADAVGVVVVDSAGVTDVADAADADVGVVAVIDGFDDVTDVGVEPDAIDAIVAAAAAADIATREKIPVVALYPKTSFDHLPSTVPVKTRNSVVDLIAVLNHCHRRPY